MLCLLGKLNIHTYKNMNFVSHDNVRKVAYTGREKWGENGS
jgi:hypothetical protein